MAGNNQVLGRKRWLDWVYCRDENLFVLSKSRTLLEANTNRALMLMIIRTIISARSQMTLGKRLTKTLEQGEFRQKKNALMERKAEIEQKLADFKRQGHNWLEPPLDRWVLGSPVEEPLVLYCAR